MSICAKFAVMTLMLLSEPAVAACEDILKYVNYDTQRNYNSLTAEQIQTANLCIAEYSSEQKSTAAQIEASYSLFKGGASGSQSEIRQFQSEKCGSRYGRDYLQSIGVAESNIVSPAAVNALESCYKSSNNFQLVNLAFAGDRFNADLRWNGLSSITVSQANFDPGKVTCALSSGADKNIKKPYQLSPNKIVNLDCSRKASIVQVAPDEKISLLQPTLVTVTSDAGSVSIPLERVSETLIPSSRLSALETQMRASVVAFDAPTCPVGWRAATQLAGRTIVGAGAGAGLSARKVGEVGGEEAHVLTVAEMPSHAHGGNVSLGGHSYEHHQHGNGRLPGEAWQGSSQSAGGGQGHNNMPPFAVLQYCKKA